MNLPVCLCPYRRAGGVLLSFFAQFCTDWWLGVHTTLMAVNHRLNVQEIDQVQAGTLPGFANACDAFNNPAWTAGKLSCVALKRGGFDDIQLKIGYDFYKAEDEHACVYAVGTIPTGNRPQSDFVFEPLVGTKHGSIGVGFNGDYDYSRWDESSIAFLVDVKYRYVFGAWERRSFDLCGNGDWSRYLLVSTAAEPLNSMPGINLFTLPVNVKPGNTLDVWLALHYQRCNFSAEIGYDLWWRQAEKIDIRCCITPGFGIQTLNVCSSSVTSSSSATICQTTPGAGSNATVSDPTFVALTTSMLNLNSGAHPTALSNTLYADLGYAIERTCYSLLFGVGASYEVASKNALSQWALWYTQGISF